MIQPHASLTCPHGVLTYCSQCVAAYEAANGVCPDCHGSGSVMNLTMPCINCKCTGKVPVAKSPKTRS